MNTKNNIKRLCVFAHYDKDGIVDDYVHYYLKSLLQVCSKLIFVSVSVNNTEDIKRLESLGIEVIVRDNVGYDFYSYKTGLEKENINQYDEVIICNDSVYGPTQSLESYFLSMKSNPADFWGFTESHNKHIHIQSYFMVFRKNVLTSNIFQQFWRKLKVLNNKEDIISNYEIGLSKSLHKKNFKSHSVFRTNNTHPAMHFFRNIHTLADTIKNKIFTIKFYKSLPNKIRNLGKVNPTHSQWKEALTSKSSPFIKIELLRDNPAKQKNIAEIIPTIISISDYPTDILKKHLKRIKN